MPDLDDETVDRVTGQFLPRGRCDTCGAPCAADTGDCTRDRAHAVALDVEDAVPYEYTNAFRVAAACARCTYLAHDVADLDEHHALNHPTPTLEA